MLEYRLLSSCVCLDKNGGRQAPEERRNDGGSGGGDESERKRVVAWGMLVLLRMEK